MVELTDIQVEKLMYCHTDKISVIGPVAYIIEYEFVVYFDKNERYYFGHINEFYRIENRYVPIKAFAFARFIINVLLRRHLKRMGI